MTLGTDFRTTLLARAALASAALALGYGLVRLAAYARVALSYPYGMDYGEGVIWQQLIRIVAGSGYAPLQQLPAFVFQYPPVYHLTVAGTAWLFGLDQLYAGRLVSLIATLVSAALAGALAAAAIGRGEDSRVRAVAGMITAACFASLPLLLTSALLMQIDMLALAFTLTGLLLAVRAVERPVLAVAAGVMFAIALYTRQTSLPAPAAAFAVLLLVRPRTAWTMAAAAVVTCCAALTVLILSGSGDFLRQILLYNVNRIAWDHAAKLLFVLLANTVPIALGIIGVAAAWRRVDPLRWRLLRGRLATEPGLAATVMILSMLVLKTLMLPMILKSGANDNYLIDWFAPLTIMVGLALVPIIRAALAQPGTPNIVLLALAGIGLPVHMSDPPLPADPAMARDRAAMAGLVARVRASPRPVISDDMVLLLRAGQPALWEPAIIAELGSAGRYDQTALAARVRRGEFGFFVTHGDRGDLIYDQRFTPVVADAIDAAYPRREIVGGLTLHLPR